MKKIFLLPLFVSLICVADAFGERGEVCGPAVISFVGAQAPDDDEFLYESKYEYDLAKAGWKNTAHENSGDGRAYECDGRVVSNACIHGSKVDMPAGHVFNGNVVNKAETYICNAAWYHGDGWEVYTGGKCKIPGRGNLDVGQQIENVSRVECSGLSKTTSDELVSLWTIYCDNGPKIVCRPAKCIDNYEVSADGNKCEPKGPVAPVKCEGANEINAPEEIILTTVCPQCQQIKKDQCVDKDMFACYKAIKYRPNNAKWNAVWNDMNACICTPANKYEWSKDKGTCVEKKVVDKCDQLKAQGASEVRLACCRAGGATVWKSGAPITSTDKSDCTCVDSSKTWDGAQCVGGSTPPLTPADCKWQSFTYVNCLNGREIVSGTTFVIPGAELNGLSCDQYSAKYGSDVGFLRDKFCGDSRYTKEVVLDAQTKKAIENMNAFFKMAEEDTTVWRTEEGKFNTARLASDATAGVVLGTVGGVVSAKVIKKNQLEKGYDALKCTIGGQKMADWGDVFNVGLRR